MNWVNPVRVCDRCKGSPSSELLFVRARPVASRDRNVQQPEENAQLRPVVDDLAESMANGFGLGRGAEDLVALPQRPGQFQLFFRYRAQGFPTLFQRLFKISQQFRAVCTWPLASSASP